MCLCPSKQTLTDLPQESRLLQDVTIRLIEPEEGLRYDQLIEQNHYLHNANVIGRVLRYVAEYRGQWVGLLTFCSAALHLKPRDQFLNWSSREVSERRHLIAQNSRFLILPSIARWPNLASRILKLVCERLPWDWKEHFGHPVLLAETFVDPQRFRGTCYKAAGWQPLGRTKGFQRHGQDFYIDTKHPKELWVRALGKDGLQQLREAQLPSELQGDRRPLPPLPSVSTSQMESLWDFVREHLADPRSPRGVRYSMATLICICTLGVAAGCQGPHAIAEFAESLNHGQRRRLRCPARRGTRRQYEIPCQRTFHRILQRIDSDQLRQAYSMWMESMDPSVLKTLHLDGKVIKNATPAPPRLKKDTALVAAAAMVDTPEEKQKPKADKALMLVNFQTPNQRLIDQIAVPRDTNEEAAVAAHLPKMDLGGVTLIADAAHTVKANCHQLTQNQGADYIFFLKGNQPNSFAKAKQLLSSDIPPSGSNH